jgi:beta-lactam-binding protein with PASTA domain/tRNA A-37 threonylcarbamoyl transferase component Bud32
VEWQREIPPGLSTLHRMDSPAADPLVGLLVDRRYLIEARVARGGMATVYQALDQRLARPVAIKVMHPHLAEDAEFTKRFIQEARHAARLAHPNIVNVFDQGQEGALTYIIMEYLPGITLRELLTDFGALTVAQTLEIVTAVLNGLGAAHTAGIVHRDLKPENVLMADDGRIKIADFGLARASTHNTATSQALLGTIAYLSPELIARGEADLRSDIYALGIMMFEMLTGEQPYQGDQAVTIAYQHSNDIVPAPSSKNSSVPAPFDELVDWCTRRSPDERPPHAHAVLEHVRALERVAGPATATRPLAAPNQTVAMTQRISQMDLQETEVLDRKATVFRGLEPTASIATVGVEDEISPQEPVAPRTRQGGSRWAWISGLVLVLLLGGGGAWWWLTGPGALTAIPDVSGVSVSEATSALAESELVVSATSLKEFDLVLPEGTVKGTSPGAGEAVDKGTEVKLIVSLGPNPVSVPSLAGETLANAQALLQELNLILGISREEFSDMSSKGTLLRLTDTSGVTLSPGTEILAGDTVDAVFSAGSLPEVSGLTVDEARNFLNQVGLTGVVGGDGAYSDSVPEGSVVEILGATTRTLTPGDTVTLVVSRGPELVTMPDVVGDTISLAKNTLENLGFTVEVRSEYPESDWDRSFARVTSVDPSAGQEVEKGTKVTLRSFI